MPVTSLTPATQTLSYPLSRKDVAPHRGIFSALTLAAKNIENDMRFCYRQLKTAYDYDKDQKCYVLKAQLFDNQKYVFQAANALLTEKPFTVVPQPAQDSENSQLPPAQTYTELGSKIPAQLMRHLLTDKTKAEGLLKAKNQLDEAQGKLRSYGSLPSAIAQRAVQGCAGQMEGHYQLSTAFYEGRLGQGAGHPQLPGYHDKNDRAGVTLSYINGHIKVPNLNLKKHDLRVCFEGEKVSEAVLSSFLNWNLQDVLDEHLRSKVIPGLERSLGRSITVRTEEELVALKAKIAPFQAQIDDIQKEKKAKFAAQTLSREENKYFNEQLKTLKYQISQLKGPQNRLRVFLKSLQFQVVPFVGVKGTWDFNANLVVEISYLSSDLAQMSASELKDLARTRDDLRIGGLDMGIVNLATMAFNTGHRGLIFSGQFLNAKLTRLHTRMDQRRVALHRSQMSPDNFNIFLLREEWAQSKPKQEALSDEEHKANLSAWNEKKPKYNEQFSQQAIAACKAIKNDATFQSLRLQLHGVKKNAIHQVSNAVVRAAFNRELDLLVIGKNEYWKTEAEMGRKMNRLFCALPHAQLIQAIQYKAHMHGIAVLCTEESYTSKTSFVHGEELKAFSKEGNNQPPAHAPKAQRKDRELILTPNEHWIEVMHADINGAFNIVRKVCPWLKFDAQQTSLRYKIWFVVDSKLRLRSSSR